MSIFFFSVLSVLLISTAVIVVTRKNPVQSAIWLVINFILLAGMYVLLNARFIAAVQVVVYAGGIMVLFLFSILLLNLGDEKKLTDPRSFRRSFAIGGAVLLGIVLVYAVIMKFPHAGGSVSATSVSTQLGSPETLGKSLFTQYRIPFEITSLILTVAILGAIMLAKKKND